MPKEFRKDDWVEWDTSQTQGQVVRKQTSPPGIKAHKVKASTEPPQYIVESDKSGALRTSRVNSEERDSSSVASEVHNQPT